MGSSSARKGKGRQKLKIEKIEKRSSLQVAFSKRKNTIFKKIFELSVVTEAEIAAVVFSPGGKAYSYGHPSIDIVAEKFLTGNSVPTTYTRNADVARMIDELKTINDKLAVEKQRGAELDKMMEQSGKQIWDIGEDILQLTKAFEALTNLKGCVEKEISSRANEGNGNGGGSGDDSGFCL